MSQDLPVTSYALLGLLTFGDELTGYELKQRADRTLRFYWVAPAMSQVYSELRRLTDLGLVTPSDVASVESRGTTYRLSPRGHAELTRWMVESEPGFPVLKHPVALRLLLGHLVDPARTVAMLERHLAALEQERQALVAVQESLRGRDGPVGPFRYPALVADWGLAYFEGEQRIVRGLLARVRADS
ncbi:MAG: PadR family transcriptional regulator [Actinomycetota bacterium]|nr:PadR family transcriptional regulator [Actinomycetota bacterium]